MNHWTEKVIEPMKNMRLSNPVIALLIALSLAACSSSAGTGGGEGSEGTHSEGGSESGTEGGGEEAATQYGLTDTFDMVRAGARLVLRYDATTETFMGTVTNTTSATLTNVRIEVHLSNGQELGPTPPIDLAPGESVPVTLDATGERFMTWGAHPEVGSQGTDDVATIMATGLDEPMETAARQDARAPQIHARSDSLIMSTVYGETDHPALPTFRILAECAGNQCSLTDSVTGMTETTTLGEDGLAFGNNEAVGSRHGITLTWETLQHEATDATSLGAWMDHSSFSLVTVSVTSPEFTAVSQHGEALGDLTGTPPGRATWLGLMVGTPVAGDDTGERLIGTAALNYDLSAGGGLDVAFSGIENVDEGRAHTTETVIFPDVPIGPGGTFSAGVVGDRIQGGFYGPEHVEAAGVFERADIVGAFGAKRQ